MYFVSYSTNKFELSQPGWNVWEVKKKTNQYYSRSYKIIKILVGGAKRPDAKTVSITDGGQYIASDEIDVIKMIFNIGSSLTGVK